MYLIEKLTPLAYPLVNRFYRDMAYPASAGKYDHVWLMRDQQKIIGALMIVSGVARSSPAAYGLLRALVVNAEYQRQGLATQLLAAMIKHPPYRVCYCFPYQHLQRLYEEAGFILCNEHDLPDDLKGAFRSYCRQGKSLLAMMRIAI